MSKFLYFYFTFTLKLMNLYTQRFYLFLWTLLEYANNSGKYNFQALFFFFFSNLRKK